MRYPILLALLMIAFAVPAPLVAQPIWGPPPRWDDPGADLAGTWFLHGDRHKPTHISPPDPRGNALFTNENGSAAWGRIEGDRVWIPSWNDGWRRGLVGIVRGDRIIWPNGTYWSRFPERGRWWR